MKGSYNEIIWLYVNDGNLLFHQDLWDEDISIDIASDTWYHVL